MYELRLLSTTYSAADHVSGALTIEACWFLMAATASYKSEHVMNKRRVSEHVEDPI